MNIETTNTLEILMIGESVTETETVHYGPCLEFEQYAEMVEAQVNLDNTGAHEALTALTAGVK